MKRLLYVLIFICIFLWIALSVNKLHAQEVTELTVPDYSYGEVFGQYKLRPPEGVVYSNPEGYYTGKDESPSGVFLANGYRWWGYPSFPLFICTKPPEFNYPGNHGVWSQSMIGCQDAPVGHYTSWGGVIIEPENRKIWSLGGVDHENMNLGFVATFGYLRRIFEVQSTGSLQEGDPVDIRAYLTSEGIFEGDGIRSDYGVLSIQKLSDSHWMQYEKENEYLTYYGISDGILSFSQIYFGINLNNVDSVTATLAIGDTIVLEVAFSNRLNFDTPTDLDAEDWIGERPHNLFTNPIYTRSDSVRSLIKKHGNTLTYDLISLTNGAVLEPVTPDGPNLDGDIDGISDVQEKGPYGNDDTFDGNADGTPDFEQATVSSFHTFDGLNYVTMVVPEGTELSQLLVTDNPSPSDAPEDAEFNYGFFDFSIDGLDPGEAITVTLILHNGVPVDKYYKYGKTPADDPVAHWYEFMYDGQTGAEINGNVIDLHFTDGLRGDEDITANGSIKEPGGPSKSITTGMSEFIETKGTIVVYPNPSTDYITLKTNNIKPADDYILKIYSITGKIIKEEMLSVPDASYEYTIPTTNLPNGIYMITLSGINISYRTKFVIQN